MVDVNGNGHGGLSFGTVLPIITLGAGLIGAWYNLASGQQHGLDMLEGGQRRVEDRLGQIETRLERVERDHDSVTRLEDQVEELFGLYGKKGTDYEPPTVSPGHPIGRP